MLFLILYSSASEPISSVIETTPSQNSLQFQTLSSPSDGFDVFEVANRENQKVEIKFPLGEVNITTMEHLKRNVEKYIGYQKEKQELQARCTYQAISNYETLFNRLFTFLALLATIPGFIDQKIGPFIVGGLILLVECFKHYFFSLIATMARLQAKRKELDENMAAIMRNFSPKTQQLIIQWFEKLFGYGQKFHKKLPKVYNLFNKEMALELQLMGIAVEQ